MSHESLPTRLRHSASRGLSHCGLLLSGLLILFSAGSFVSVEGAPPPGAVSVCCAAPPDAALGQPYTYSLAADGGTPPYTFLVVSGAIPAGLAISPAGDLTGTPTQSGVFRFSVRATDSAGGSGALGFTLRVTNTNGLQFSFPDPPIAARGIPYAFQLVAQGGSQPYSFDLFPGGGALPLGLTLDATGRIAGNPLVAGTFPVTFRVTDKNGVSFTTATALIVTANMLAIDNTSIISGSVGSAYNQILTATGGSSPYLFSVSSGALPVGLSLSSTGFLSGTPMVAGAYAFVIRVTDAASQSAQASYSLVISSGQFKIIDLALPSAQTGVAYNQQLTSVGGTAPVVFLISGGFLPASLTLSATGLLSGSATTAGTFQFTVKAIDANLQNATQNFTLYVNSSAFSIVTTTLPTAAVGQIYSSEIVSSGGASPVALSISSGSLPPGLQLSSTGSITGTPIAPGSYSFTLRAQDANSQFTQKSLSISVANSGLSFNGGGLPAGQVGSAYTGTVSAINGASPYAYTLVGGTLPAGLTLAQNGNVSGTPIAAGIYQVTIRVTDANARTADQGLTIFVNSMGFSVNPNAIPSASLNQPYSATLSGFGGTTPYSFQLVSGTLPSGLSLTSPGVIAGTSTAAGPNSFSIRATDSANAVFLLNYTLNVNASAIVLAPLNLPNGQLNLPYATSMVASGGTGPYLFSLTSGALPPGLSLAPNGLFSGTPGATGPYAFTIRVTDSTNAVSLFTYALSVSTGGLSIVTQSVPAAVVGTDYFTAVIATGGSAPYVYTISSGALPPGLTFTRAGVFSGLPTAAGTYSVNVRVDDAAGNFIVSSITIVVNSAGSLSIVTAALPTARTNQTYSTTIAASGGRAPYTFTLISGALLAGLQVNADGSITGKATADGVSTFTVRVLDALGATAQATLSLSSNSSNLTITTVSFINGRIGELFQQSVLATGGNAPYLFTLAAGPLPNGLTLSGSGILSGTPTVGGSFPIVIRVTDAAGMTYQTSYKVLIGSTNLDFTNTTLPKPYIGSQYFAVLQAAGGIAPYQFSVASGVLPAGLSLAPSGEITGTVAAGSGSTITFRVVDATGASASTTISLIPVQSPLQFSFTSIPAARVGQFYLFVPTATGGSGPYVFSVGAPLPLGLFLTPVGNIAGTPKVAGTYTIVFRGQDTSGTVVQNSYRFDVLGDGLQITAPVVPAAKVGQPFTLNFNSTGANGEVRYDLASGILPSGLVLSTSGMLSGTPTTAGAYRFSVRATDAQGVTTQLDIAMTVSAI